MMFRYFLFFAAVFSLSGFSASASPEDTSLTCVSTKHWFEHGEIFYRTWRIAGRSGNQFGNVEYSSKKSCQERIKSSRNDMVCAIQSVVPWEVVRSSSKQSYQPGVFFNTAEECRTYWRDDLAGAGDLVCSPNTRFSGYYALDALMQVSTGKVIHHLNNFEDCKAVAQTNPLNGKICLPDRNSHGEWRPFDLASRSFVYFKQSIIRNGDSRAICLEELSQPSQLECRVSPDKKDEHWAYVEAVLAKSNGVYHLFIQDSSAKAFRECDVWVREMNHSLSFQDRR